MSFAAFAGPKFTLVSVDRSIEIEIAKDLSKGPYSKILQVGGNQRYHFFGVLTVDGYRRFFVIDLEKGNEPTLHFRYSDENDLNRFREIFGQERIWGRIDIQSDVVPPGEHTPYFNKYKSLPPTQGKSYFRVTLKEMTTGVFRKSVIPGNVRIESALANARKNSNWEVHFEFYGVERNRLELGKDLPEDKRLIWFQEGGVGKQVDLYELVSSRFETISFPQNRMSASIFVGGIAHLPLQDSTFLRIPLAIDILPNAVTIKFFHGGSKDVVQEIEKLLGELKVGQFNQKQSMWNDEKLRINQVSYDFTLTIKSALNSVGDLEKLAGGENSEFISIERLISDYLSLLRDYIGLQLASPDVVRGTEVSVVNKMPGIDNLCSQAESITKKLSYRGIGQ